MIYRWYKKISKSLEHVFYVESATELSQKDQKKLLWLIAEPNEPKATMEHSFWGASLFRSGVVEIGPRLSIETPFSSNAVAICQAMNIPSITRIEFSKSFQTSESLTVDAVLKEHLDRMTETEYSSGITSFDTGIVPAEVEIIDLIGGGKDELRRQNKKNGWGMDERDIDYNFDYFVNVLKRNPTDVELLQLGNGNSEHSRHWFFKGQIVIDGVPMRETLLELVKNPLQRLKHQNITLKAFNDNAGVIRGFKTTMLIPREPGKSSELILVEKVVHFAATAETHNHPFKIAPFPGAATGAGGRIRDNRAVGQGAFISFGVAYYFTGNLFISGYDIPGEIVGKDKPSKYASPRSMMIEGPRGVHGYGNEIGEPLIAGSCRTFGQIVDGEWREPRKPILYSGGISQIFDEHLEKQRPEVGMLIVRIGGTAYPIGVGGGSASSMMQGENTEELDFNSVQRGNAEMENRANRVIRACVEMGDKNPIASIHDQGAGGPSNALTEILEPVGGAINIRKIILGDKTMSVLQIWSAECQENYALLIRPKHIELFQSVCQRERVNCEVVGEIDGSGKVVVEDPQNGTVPVNLDLEQILSKMPQKTFESTRKPKKLEPLDLTGVTIGEAIEKVLKLPSVGSKAHLVHRVDRSVTGLVAGQQCCGIAQIPIGDAGVIAQSYFGSTGVVCAIGEQPIKMLIDSKAGARMSVAEMLTNIASVKICHISDIRCRANWMWPAKLPGEGALLYDAAIAMSDLMIELSIAIDGGKDSLSMADTVSGETVKTPGSLVIFGYASVPRITKKVTPDIKKPGESFLGLIDLGLGKNRMGGSALAQAYNQLGDESPDVDDPNLLLNAFRVVQQMIEDNLILSMHDRSDGGLFTAVAEMCMASRCGFLLKSGEFGEELKELFAEELGFIIEYSAENADLVKSACSYVKVPFKEIGHTIGSNDCVIGFPRYGGMEKIWDGTIEELRLLWESTSHELEKLQINPECAREEYSGLSAALPSINSAVSYYLTFSPKETSPRSLKYTKNPRVAILREEGTNGDREMAAACKAAGLRPTDIHMEDLLKGKANLDAFQGLIFPGGFSFMDVFGSAKGQAGVIRFNDKLREMFDRFYNREDACSLGVCNGAQLEGLLGWVKGRFVQNRSLAFESQWVQAEILLSSSILFTDMVGSKLPIWVAHGEGRVVFPDKETENEVRRQKLIPLAYIDPYANRTEKYPYNPNGSPFGIAALCTPNGQHTAMMPHPERSFRLWQCPWLPPHWHKLEASPWLQMFQNMREWCLAHRV